ncbi:MAG: DUF4293 domain-containing protein [Dysgonamonadaceae bacterium]|jgi:hypothetical protein|nr:DUF4293 domain-containing protein [Dysgonamonadaceae bacterium]
MIQRIQTVWILSIALLNVGLFFLPAVSSETAPCFPYQWIPDAEIGLTVLLAIAAIFLYKRRQLQIKWCYAILILQMALFASFFLIVPKATGATLTATDWNFPILFPFISLVLDVLAIRAIKKDEKLVRSLDRLR